jgi:hypothetical protein
MFATFGIRVRYYQYAGPFPPSSTGIPGSVAIQNVLLDLDGSSYLRSEVRNELAEP